MFASLCSFICLQAVYQLQIAIHLYTSFRLYTLESCPLANYSRGQYKVSVTYRSVPIFRPYRTFKKRLARPYRFILLGVTQYYCYTRSEYRAESSSMWIFLVCLLLLFFPPVSYSAVPLHSVDCFLFLLFLSIKSFSSRPFRSSPSIVSAVLVARSASVCRLFMLF